MTLSALKCQKSFEKSKYLIVVSEALKKKKLKSVDFFHTGGGPGQIHTFIKVQNF